MLRLTCLFRQLTVLLAIILTLPLSAQTDLSADLPYFQRQARQYQRWLDTLGLSPMIKVEEVRLMPDPKTGQPITTELEMLLTMQSANPDSAAAQWFGLNKSYTTATGRSLKADLFRSFTHAMDIPPAHGNIQIYARKVNYVRSPCFFVWVWDDKGILKDSLLTTCKNQPIKVVLPPVSIKKAVGKNKSIIVTKPIPSNEVFDRIMTFVRTKYPYHKYDNTNCSGRHPEVIEEGRTETELLFIITELCREVLTSEDNSLWCKAARKTGWQKDCTDIKRERLEFTVNYSTDSKGVVTLNCVLRGKFGASDYVPRSMDYYDMDPDFLSFEHEFAKQFERELTKFLK